MYAKNEYFASHQYNLKNKKIFLNKIITWTPDSWRFLYKSASAGELRKISLYMTISFFTLIMVNIMYSNCSLFPTYAFSLFFCRRTSLSTLLLVNLHAVIRHAEARVKVRQNQPSFFRTKVFREREEGRRGSLSAKKSQRSSLGVTVIGCFLHKRLYHLQYSIVKTGALYKELY